MVTRYKESERRIDCVYEGQMEPSVACRPCKLSFCSSWGALWPSEATVAPEGLRLGACKPDNPVLVHEDMELL